MTATEPTRTPTGRLEPRTLTTNVLGMLEALAAKPGDHLTRLILADALADAGDERSAEAMRWLAEKDRHACGTDNGQPNYSSTHDDYGDRQVWDWYDGEGSFWGEEPEERPAVLPASMLCRMTKGNRGYFESLSPLEADLAVCAAFASATPEEIEEWWAFVPPER